MATPDLEALHRLKIVEPPRWILPSSELSGTAREASKQLFDFLNPYVPKTPFDHLLVDDFDAEQIWQQIDLQSHHLITTLRREVKRLEKYPEKIANSLGEKKAVEDEKEVSEGESKFMEDGFDEDVEEIDGEEDEDSEEEGEEGEEREGRVEDKFLKLNELEEYLDEDEAREFGLKRKRKKGGDNEVSSVDGDDEKNGEEDEDDDIDEDDDELGDAGLGDHGGEGIDKLANARYEDFFAHKRKIDAKRKSNLIEGSEDSETENEAEPDAAEATKNQKTQNLSTHEKEQLKLQSKIEQMEKENMEPKAWTMQGEITAAKRPKNSALEVDLDFEHNARPAPVITEEVTACLEELIQKRILEGQYDDVQRHPTLSRAPRERKELDENKSKKGLAEIYEEEYVQKMDLGSAQLSFSDEQKKEASMLFKKLCLKLDVLSHFHFAPKPVIEDMSIQANVPALAMEEIAPMAVSDAAMLAPEEVFAGKVEVKGDAELTQEDRKRRRAKKKRKYKAECVKMAVKAHISTPQNGVEEP